MEYTVPEATDSKGINNIQIDTWIWQMPSAFLHHLHLGLSNNAAYSHTYATHRNTTHTFILFAWAPIFNWNDFTNIDT